jgi:hypothetical protein
MEGRTERMKRGIKEGRMRIKQEDVRRRNKIPAAKRTYPSRAAMQNLG